MRAGCALAVIAVAAEVTTLVAREHIPVLNEMRALAVAQALPGAILVGLAIFALFRSATKRRELQWPPRMVYKRACIMAVAALLATIGLDVYSPTSLSSPDLVSNGVARSLFMASFLTPFGLWLMRAPDLFGFHAGTLKEPDRAVALAMATALGLLALLSFASLQHGREGWLRQESLPELLNLAGRQRMLSQRIIVLAQTAERLPLTERQRTLWKLEATLADFERQLVRVIALAEGYQSNWLGDFRRTRTMLDHAVQLHRGLVAQGEAALTALRRGEPIPSDLALSGESFLTKMDSTLLRIHSQASEMTANAIEANSRIYGVHLGTLVLLCLWVAVPIVKLVRSQQRQEVAARAELAAFIKHAPAAVAMFDRDMRYVATSERWCREFGILSDQLIGQRHGEVLPDLPQYWVGVHARCSEGSVEVCEDEVILRHDGRSHHLRWEMRPWLDERDRIGGVMMLAEDIAERKAIEQSLTRLAKIDPLTGLPNRFVFLERLEAAIAGVAAGGRGFAIGIIDLDGFKEINDTYGHDVGDILLREMGQRFQSALASGTVVRLGGDEFAVLLENATCEADIVERVESLFQAVAAPVLVDGNTRRSAMSLGLTFCPEDARTPSDLLKNADLALYRAKALGRNRYEVFTSELRASLENRERLRGEVELALATNAFELVYQPIVAIDGLELKGFEALLRWAHPVRGLLAPGSFIDAFDNPKIAEAIGTRVRELALAQASRWQSQGFAFGRISINVTSADFADGHFAERVRDELSRFGVTPGAIAIEVTEGMFLGRGSQHVATALDALHGLGVSIALDDFGTGFASLSHVKQFPIDRLKIDRSFVRDIEHDGSDIAIVRAITDLGRGLGLEVTAEGVETSEQVALLADLGCPTVQGYLIARPLSPQDAEIFMRMRGRVAPKGAGERDLSTSDVAA